MNAAGTDGTERSLAKGIPVHIMARSKPKPPGLHDWSTPTPIDPEGRYPTRRLRPFEEIALEVLRCLPGAAVQRTRDVIQIDYEGERGIIVILGVDTLELRLPRVVWDGPHTPMQLSTLWRRLDLGELHMGDLPNLLAAALAARRAQLTTCRYCGKAVPPEHRFNENTCHGCAQRHLGVVF